MSDGKFKLTARELARRAMRDRKLYVEASYIAANIIAKECGCSFAAAMVKVAKFIEAEEDLVGDRTPPREVSERDKTGEAPATREKYPRKSVAEVTDALRTLLASDRERFGTGKRIPSGRKLEPELKAAHTAVANALNALVDEGVLQPVRAGLIVHPDWARKAYGTPEL